MKKGKTTKYTFLTDVFIYALAVFKQTCRHLDTLRCVGAMYVSSLCSQGQGSSDILKAMSIVQYCMLGLKRSVFSLKAVDTIGNCQRLAFTVGVSQHMHKITNL